MKSGCLAGLAIGTLGLGCLLGAGAAAHGQQGDSSVLQLMNDLNDVLKPQWLDYRVEQIEFLTIGKGRPSARIHQRDFRWVSGDPRRHADGDTLSYLVDPSWGEATSGGVTQAAPGGPNRPRGDAVGGELVSRPAGGQAALPRGRRHDLRLFPRPRRLWRPLRRGHRPRRLAFRGQRAAGPDVLGISVTFIFVDPATGEPTDLDGDQRLDTALNEIYYNDRFVWSLSGAETAGTFDVETVALHESGHAFAVGHFGSPPEAVMNPVYAGIRRKLYPMDHAGLCTVWGNW
jgi:hypothetical protein